MELSKTLEFGSLKVAVTVRGKTGFDRYVENILFSRLYERVTGTPYSGDKWMTPETQAINQIVALINRTVAVSGLPIEWANASSDPEKLCASYEYLKQIPASIWDDWVDLVEEADKPPGDPDTLPPDKLSDDKKKTPKS